MNVEKLLKEDSTALKCACVHSVSVKYTVFFHSLQCSFKFNVM